MEKLSVYNSIYIDTDESRIQTDRQMIFIPSAFINKETGEFHSVSIGQQMINNETGYQFIVDNNVGEQFHKLIIDFSEGEPSLYIKDGEKIETYMSKEEEEIRDLELQLQIKRAELNQIN